MQHRYTPVECEDEAQSQVEVHSLERLLYRVFLFCPVTNAALNSVGMNEVVLPQGITARFSPCAILEAVRGWRARQCVSITESRLEETLKEQQWVSLGSAIADHLYFLCDLLCLPIISIIDMSCIYSHILNAQKEIHLKKMRWREG